MPESESAAQVQNKYINLGVASILGVLFLTLYVPFATVQNIMTETQKAAGFGQLGFELLAILYLFQMFGSLIGPPVVTKIGLKNTFFVGGLMLSLVVFCQVGPSWYADQLDNHKTPFISKTYIEVILIFGSVFGGLG